MKVNFALLNTTGQVIPDAVVSAYTQTIETGKDLEFKVLILDDDATTYRPLPPSKASVKEFVAAIFLEKKKMVEPWRIELQTFALRMRIYE